MWALSGPDYRPAESESVAVNPAGNASGPWIAVGGGGVPESNQVSIEQDMALANSVLGPGGQLLFAAGPGSHSVQVLFENKRGKPLVNELGAFFSPRAGRDSIYRPTTLPAGGPATVANTRKALVEALSDPADKRPLLFFFAGHGEQGDEPRFNLLRLWGRFPLTVEDLARTLDAAVAARRVRVVITSCFSGGFGDIVFTAADQANGATTGDRCGFFASPWDLEATGCDPNPDRRLHESYSLYFFNALRGLDRHGKPLAKVSLDLDGDGRISLLEAHTRVRISDQSSDVPTTTSERWLRYVALAGGPEADIELPEEDAVITAMAQRLELSGREREATGMLAHARTQLEQAKIDLEDARVAEDDAWSRAAADLLARWAMLDDPWHPDFERLMQKQSTQIAEHLEQSDSYKAYLESAETTNRVDDFLGRLRLQAAPLERLVRAQETRVLARRLKARGGPEWDTYQRLLTCERSAP